MNPNQATTRSTMRSWESDRITPNGPTSMEVLLTWLSTPGNYAQWQGQAKYQLCEDIKEKLAAAGIHSRTPKAIHSKVTKVTRQYALTRDWLEEIKISDDDIKQEQLESSLKAVLDKKCLHYAELVPIFGDLSPASKPPVSRENDGVNGNPEEKVQTRAEHKRTYEDEQEHACSSKQLRVSPPEVTSDVVIHDALDGLDVDSSGVLSDVHQGDLAIPGEDESQISKDWDVEDWVAVDQTSPEVQQMTG